MQPELKQSVDGNIVAWEYDSLCVLGAIGVLGKPLEKLQESYKDIPIEFAPVKKEPARDFLAAFCFDPVMDITIVQSGMEASIVTYSLDKESSLRFVNTFVQTSGLIPYAPETGFIETIGNGVKLLEITSYAACRQISQMTGVEIEKAFGAVHYSNFLTQYNGFSLPDGMEKAYKKFGLSFRK